MESRGLVSHERLRPRVIIGLVIPTRWEAGPVLRHFQMRSAGPDLFKASVGEQTLWVRVSGVGREKARTAADRLCKEQQVKMLASVGFCGALIPALNVGDVIRERIVTVDVPAKTPEQRTALTQRANAVAVDMETQAIIEAGTLRGVPIRVVRVVSDRFEDDLTPLLGDDGDFSFLKIGLRLLNPALWPLAARLRRQSATASRALLKALDAWLVHPID